MKFPDEKLTRKTGGGLPLNSTALSGALTLFNRTETPHKLHKMEEIYKVQTPAHAESSDQSTNQWRPFWKPQSIQYS